MTTTESTNSHSPQNQKVPLLGTSEFDTPTPINVTNISIPQEFYRRCYCGVKSIDNLFNGFVPGQVIGLYAHRGCGKTTFLLQLSSLINSFNNTSSLYVTNEETVEQLAYTSRRIQALHNIYLSHNSFIEDIIHYLPKYPIVILDSLSGVTTKNKQIRYHDVQTYALQQLYKNAKIHKTIVFFTLHMSKNRKVAIGKTAIEHIADAIFKLDAFEEKNINNGRRITVEKNRMGSIGEISVTIDQSGFDFTNVLSDKTTNDIKEEDINKSAIAMKETQKNRIITQETEEILKIAKTNGKINYNDINELANSNIQIFERLERRIKSLVKMGILEKIGPGEFVYNNKQT